MAVCPSRLYPRVPILATPSKGEVVCLKYMFSIAVFLTKVVFTELEVSSTITHWASFGGAKWVTSAPLSVHWPAEIVVVPLARMLGPGAAVGFVPLDPSTAML